MQRKHLGQAMRYLVAVCALISTFAILACGGDDEDEVEILNVTETVEADADTVPAVQGRPFTIPNGQVFGGNTTDAVIFTFTTPSTFTATRAAPSLSLSGNVSYGSDDSCTFTATIGGALPVSNCNLLVNANNLVVGTGQVSGTISLVLRNNAGITITSDPLPATVFINGDGELFVVNPVTGVSVNMGVEP